MPDIQRPDQWPMGFRIRGKCWTLFYNFLTFNVIMSESSGSNDLPPSRSEKNWKLFSQFTSKRNLAAYELMYKIADFTRAWRARAACNIKTPTLQCLMFFSSPTQTTAVVLTSRRTVKKTTLERRARRRRRKVWIRSIASETKKLSIFHIQCFTDSAPVLLIAKSASLEIV